jgi:hypothetical protein
MAEHQKHFFYLSAALAALLMAAFQAALLVAWT